MPEYKAPLRDIKFVMQELYDCHNLYAKLGYEDATADMFDAILSEAAKFVSEEIAPLNISGDQEGCHFENGIVTTPKGFKQAYQKYVEGGWPTLAQNIDYGGQGLPHSIHTIVNEMLSSANHSFAMYPGLSHGCMATLEKHGSEQQKQMFLPKLVSGQWTGTMCLTEPHAGTDLGLLRCKAELNDDGSYRLNGTKIFISAGDHDLSDNIVHIVIARIPGSPAGTKGISLFAVPKFNVTDEGEKSDRNGVSVGSIEHKMGIKASATCVINFDNAKGYLIGEVNRGLNMMFTFMNSARLAVGGEGLAASEAAFQGALAYAKERLQMRSVSGVKNPDGVADPIIVHPDVRRMLLTQKVFAEGGRAMIYDLALTIDKSHRGSDLEKAAAEAKLALLTPVAKAFATETAMEATSHGVQVFGGHGYISEWGMEQLMRDTKISCLYEGTTGIQAIDLLARKVLGSQGKLLAASISEITSFLVEASEYQQFSALSGILGEYCTRLQSMTKQISVKAQDNADEVGAASVDYLMFLGYVLYGYYWLKMMLKAQQSLQSSATEQDFYQSKLIAGQFYFDRILPRALSHALCIENGGHSMMALESEHFAF
ncbi:acyl-CoA dehydrogenase C-terminal domain-containing protein [Paraferrimonas sp. SM1919]|uniref:acyl-CoA dehydrogenase C-terminal domain-containing protein n=1 Tax=Paraferrimonas sp. SM1919 TaxID=2662263 RepID=UPI0013D1BE1A|nr:acyl-CoA dehydrogenase C-terminal domain-containing protein [Paraferrimonas sp. SM1919]